MRLAAPVKGSRRRRHSKHSSKALSSCTFSSLSPSTLLQVSLRSGNGLKQLPHLAVWKGAGLLFFEAGRCWRRQHRHLEPSRCLLPLACFAWEMSDRDTTELNEASRINRDKKAIAYKKMDNGAQAELVLIGGHMLRRDRSGFRYCCLFGYLPLLQAEGMGATQLRVTVCGLSQHTPALPLPPPPPVLLRPAGPGCCSEDDAF